MLLDLGLVLLDAGEEDRARRVMRQWRELPLIPFISRPRAWNLLALAALGRRAGDQTAAATAWTRRDAASSPSTTRPAWPSSPTTLSRC